MSPLLTEKRYPFEKETELLLGICIEIQKILGTGFSEIVYKDALELELTAMGIGFEREKKYSITYKSNILPHYFFADFVVFGCIILEIKCKSEICSADYAQTINYLKCSGCKIGVIVNFGSDRLGIKRVIL